MPTYSHSKNEDGKKIGSKLLIDHLRGVRQKAFQNLFLKLGFTWEKQKIITLLDAVCWLHDLGKYTKFFQKYLLTDEPIDPKEKAHSAFGAHAAYHLFKEEPELASIAFYLIRMHHSPLLNLEHVLKPPNFNEILDKKIFEKQVANLHSFEDLVHEFEPLKSIPFEYFQPKELHRSFKKNFQKSITIEHYFLINYLFSLLIEADKIDASSSSIYERNPIARTSVDERFGNVIDKRNSNSELDLYSLSQNDLRDYVRHQVEKNIENDDLLNKRIFTLAAPTGIGKTMTALSFALKLRDKISPEDGYLPQIIYGLPFINIIEQALSEYEQTLTTGKIIGHYQYADVFGTSESKDAFLMDEDKTYSQKQMEWDTWQSDIVITSFVQFFETLIGNQNRLLKKFHHYAGSIIILDEVQTLSIEKLPVIAASLHFLAKYLNARILVMTATQPKLFELMERELHIASEPHLKPFNLLHNDAQVFECFNRTKIIPYVDKRIGNDEFAELFLEKWDGHKNSLIVVNKVQRSIDLFNLLKKKLKDSNAKLHYLSTNITPAQRERRIQKIKEQLPLKGQILISTQVVEAGVDLDFDAGFRDLGPIDSIVQVAGRINRENSKERMGSPLYIIDFGDCVKIYGPATDSRARLILRKRKVIEEKNYKSLVDSYFEEMSGSEATDFSYSKQIFSAMQRLEYAFPNGLNAPRKAVSDFEIIDKKHQGISVFIESPDDKDATESRIAYVKLKDKKVSKSEFDQHFKRTFNQRIIAVPAFLENVKELQSEPKLNENILWVRPELWNSYYSDATGFIRSQTPTNTTVFF